MNALGMSRFAHRILLAVLLSAPSLVTAQVSPLPGGAVGMDTRYVFDHTTLAGAVATDFSFIGAFAPLYPEGVSHTVVIVFEWGPSATGPWTVSPDHVNSVPGGMTDVFSTGVFRAPATDPFVAIHFYAGGLMIATGEFTHLSVVPEPATAILALAGLVVTGLALRRQRRAAPTAAGAR